MNEKEQADFYDDQRSKGSAAFMHKQGLGFSGPPRFVGNTIHHFLCGRVARCAGRCTRKGETLSITVQCAGHVQLRSLQYRDHRGAHRPSRSSGPGRRRVPPQVHLDCSRPASSPVCRRRQGRPAIHKVSAQRLMQELT